MARPAPEKSNGKRMVRKCLIVVPPLIHLPGNRRAEGDFVRLGIPRTEMTSSFPSYRCFTNSLFPVSEEYERRAIAGIRDEGAPPETYLLAPAEAAR